jgi:hypothetical protein
MKKFTQSVKNTPKARPIDLAHTPKGVRLMLSRYIHRLRTEPSRLVGVRGTVPRRLKALEKLSLALVLGALLGSAACTSFRSYPVSPLDHRLCAAQLVVCSDKLPQASCEALEGAIGFWNHVAGETLFKYRGRAPVGDALVGAPDSGLLIVGPQPPGLRLPSAFDGLRMNAFTAFRKDNRTFCFRAGGVILLVTPKEATPESLENTLRHELGHVLGLQDTLDPSGVMFGAGDRNEHDLIPLSDAEKNALYALYRGGF